MKGGNTPNDATASSQSCKSSDRHTGFKAVSTARCRRPSFPRRWETTGQGGHATLSNSPLSNYWLRNGERLRPWRKLVPRRRETTQPALRPRHCGLGLPVHRDENDEERSSSALKAHTLAQHDQRLVNPEVKGGGTPRKTNRQNPPLP